jgi:hypothetical protein
VGRYPVAFCESAFVERLRPKIGPPCRDATVPRSTIRTTQPQDDIRGSRLCFEFPAPIGGRRGPSSLRSSGSFLASSVGREGPSAAGKHAIKPRGWLAMTREARNGLPRRSSERSGNCARLRIPRIRSVSYAAAVFVRRRSERRLVGLAGVEPATSRLSGGRSDRS